MVEFSEWSDADLKQALGRAAREVLMLSKELGERGYSVSVDSGELNILDSGLKLDGVK